MSLLPNVILQNGNTSQAEIYIFQKAKHCSLLKSDYKILFHSVDLPQSKYKLKGEVDFIYLDNEYLFFLEVKGGSVKYDSTTNDWFVMGGSLKKDPFKQAYDSLFEVRDRALPKNFPHKDYSNRLKLGIGVMFPDCGIPENFNSYNKSYKGNSIEYDFDIIYLNSDHKLDNSFDLYIKRLKAYWGSKERYQKYHNGISNDEVLEIKNYIRTDLIFKVPLLSFINDGQEKTKFYSEEQLHILEQINNNPNHGSIIEGGPGTGKTLLALEKTGELCIGCHKTLLVCYNRNLSTYLESKFKNSFPFIDTNLFEISSFHRFLIKILKENNVEFQIEDRNEFWEEELPSIFLDHIEHLKFERFDRIVIDETQDLFSQKYLDCLEKLFVGGWKSNNWSIFIDSKYQTIYSSFDKELFNIFKETYDGFTFELYKNYRNTEKIISTASAHTGFESIPCLREGKIDPSLKLFNSNKDLIVKLNKQISELLSEGVPKGWITILCSNKIIDLLVSYDQNKFRRISSATDLLNSGYITVSTPHSFKGLENEIIIYIGKDEFNSEDKELIKEIYLSYTRAKNVLISFISSFSENSFNKFIITNL